MNHEEKEKQIRQQIQHILKAKEKKIIKDIGILRNFGKVKLITTKEKLKILEDLEIKITLPNIIRLNEIIEEERNKREDEILKEAANTYEIIVQKITENSKLKKENIKKLKEAELWKTYEKIKNVKEEIDFIRLEKLQEKYNNLRKTILFYHENLIGYVAHQVNISNHHLTSNLSKEDILEYAIEYFLSSYYDYIRKYNNEEKPSRETRLSTFFINRIRSTYKRQTSKEIYESQKINAGGALKGDLQKASSNIILRISANQKINELLRTREKLRKKLNTEPTIKELAEEMLYTEEKILKILELVQLYENGTYSLDDLVSTNLEKGTLEISDEMKSEIIDAYIDSFADEYDSTKFLEDDLKSLDEEYGMPQIEDGIIIDNNEESAIEGYEMLEASIANETLRKTLEKLLRYLTEREQQIIKLRFGFDDKTPKTLEEVCKKLGLSGERIRQIEGRALAKMRLLYYKEEDGKLIKKTTSIEQLKDYLYNPIEESYNPMIQTMKTNQNKQRK